MYKAGIHHTGETCIRLALVQDKCYGRTRLVVRTVLAAIPIIAGYLVGYDKLGGILLLVLGVMMYYFTSHMYERDAERALRKTPEKYRRVDYTFTEEGFTVEAGGVRREERYDAILSLAMDGFYYYLFLNPQQAYMVELRSAGRAEEDAFEAFLRERTGKRWRIVRAREPFHRVLRRQWAEKRSR